MASPYKARVLFAWHMPQGRISPFAEKVHQQCENIAITYINKLGASTDFSCGFYFGAQTLRNLRRARDAVVLPSCLWEL